MVELYKDKLGDLLVDAKNHDRTTVGHVTVPPSNKLDVKKDASGLVYVENATVVDIDNAGR